MSRKVAENVPREGAQLRAEVDALRARTAQLRAELGERERAQETLRYRLERAELLTSIFSSLVLLPPAEIDDGIEGALAAVGTFVDVDRAGLFLFSDDRRTESSQHEWCAPGVESLRSLLRDVPRDDYPWFRELIENPEIVAVSSILDLPPRAAAEHAAFEEQGIQSLVAVPVVLGDAILGYLQLVTVGRERSWPDDVLALLRIVGDTFAAALDRRRSLDLERGKRAAEAASEAKSRFLARMSHEIRTPMNAVIGLAGLLADADLPAAERKHAGVLKAAAEGLLQLIDDVLDFSKIEAGHLMLNTVDFALEEVVESAVDPFLPRTESREVEIRLDVTREFPTHLRGDPTRLRQVLHNLIDNALKFTDHGTVEVKVRQESFDDQGVRLRFSVRDTGIGIPAEVRSQLFNPFARGDGPISQRYGGTGLGLVISQRLVDLMGGELGLDSAPGKGSTFWFEIPFTPSLRSLGPRETAAGPARTPYRRRDPATCRLLLAEDNEVNRIVAMSQLDMLGFPADAVTNGAEALAALGERDYDLILMDCQMPELDGYEATRRIRADEEPGGRRLPVIAVTAHAMKGDREKCLAAGMDDYVAKPFQREELLAMLERWLPPEEE